MASGSTQLGSNINNGSVIAGVSSFNGRTGAVSPAPGDYTASEITNVPAGNISSTNVQDAINELDTEKQATNATLQALAAFNSNGIIVQTALATFVSRSIVAGSSKVSVANGDGVAGNPSIDVVEANISRNALGGGVLTIANGGTNSGTALNNNRIMTSAAGAIVEAAALTNGQLLIGSTGAAPVASTITAGTGISVSNAAGSIEISAFAPSANLSLFEDWIGDAVGILRWLDADVAGQSITSLTSASANHPGILELSTLASATGQGIRYLGGVTTGAATAGVIMSGGSIMMECMVMVPILATGVETFNFHMGLADSAAGAANRVSMSFVYTSSTTNFVATSASASVNTITDTGVPIVAGQWYKLKFITNSAGTSVTYFIDGVSVATIITNLPTAVTIAPQVRLIKAAGTTARIVNVDYYHLTQTFAVAR